MKQFLYLMKKLFLVLFASGALLFSFLPTADAVVCTDPAATGIVPCGVSLLTVYSYDIKCRYDEISVPPGASIEGPLTRGSFTALSLTQARSQLAAIEGPLSCPPPPVPFFSPAVYGPGTKVISGPYAGSSTLFCRCEVGHLFLLMLRIYDFIVWMIALPLAALMIVAGGVLMIVSAGNPGLAGTGKNILKLSVIALILIFGSWLIIDVVLKTIGYVLPWSRF